MNALNITTTLLALLLTTSALASPSMLDGYEPGAEAKEGSRPDARNRVIGGRAGMMQPLSGAANFEPLLVSHFDLRMEKGRTFMELGAGFALPATQHTLNASYGGLFARMGAGGYLDAERNVYLSGGIEPRLQFSRKSVVGLAPYSAAGVTFGRAHGIQVFAEVRGAWNVFGVGVNDGHEEDFDFDDDDFRDDRIANPFEVGLMFGLGG